MTGAWQQEVTDAAERLEQVAPGYLDQVRRAAARLGVRAGAASDARLALADLEDAASIDIDVPTASPRREAAALKSAVKRLTAWYLRYLGQQVTVLGQATARLGGVLVARTESLEASIGRLDGEVQDLDSRLKRLEAAPHKEDRLEIGGR